MNRESAFSYNNEAYTNNNNILLCIINELQQIINYSKEDLTIKRISDIINKMNFFFKEYKRDHESIMNQFTLQQSQFVLQQNQSFLQQEQLTSIRNKLDQLNLKLEINNPKELKSNNSRYFGQVVNGFPEGRGIEYYNNGER